MKPCCFTSPHALLRMAVMTLMTGLVACGGSGVDNASASFSGTDWRENLFDSPSAYEQSCVSPRSGIDPATGQRYTDQQGSEAREKAWLRAWTHDTYLWYDEVPDHDPNDTSLSVAAYFDVMKTPLKTASGTARDRFHFSYPTDYWNSLASQGVAPGYGFALAVLHATVPREVVISYVEPAAPAQVADNGLGRGVRLLAVDGVDIVNDQAPSGVDTIIAGLEPDTEGEVHQFRVLDVGSQTPRTVTLTAAAVTSRSVPTVKTVDAPGGKVGYILFNDHMEQAELQIRDAVDTLATTGITDLVLDLRYNGGGLLDIASEVAYMIAGPTRTSGKVFERMVFNDQHQATDPVFGQPITPTPFFSQARGFSLTAGTVLPTLNLSRVFVLTTSDTCSASESIINGLRGVGVEVIQIGSTTCGKPYGFYPTDNCGTTYFSIQFEGRNDLGFGEYSDGFAPQNDGVAIGEHITGCAVGDDFSHALGDGAERMFKAALDYRLFAICPGVSITTLPTVRHGRGPALQLSPLKKIRVITPAHRQR